MGYQAICYGTFSPCTTRVRTLFALLTKREAAGMRVGTYKSEAVVLSHKRVEFPLQVGCESLPQVGEFKYLRGFVDKWR